MELTVTILLNLFGLIGTAIAISFALVGKDVVRGLDSIEAQELPELKRRMARCLMLFAVWALISIPAALVFGLWIINRGADDGPPETAWWLGFALLPGAFAGFRAIEFVCLCFRFAHALREPNTIKIRELVRLGSSALCGQNSVVTYVRQNRD